MRILGIDYGTKNIGIAISDPLGLGARPLEVMNNGGDLFANIKRVCDEYEVSKIVVGLPKTLKGDESFAAADVRAFAKRLELNVKLPVEFYDERMTTASAQKLMISLNASRKERKGNIDKIAAAIMLQSYMERNTKSQTLNPK